MASPEQLIGNVDKLEASEAAAERSKELLKNKSETEHSPEAQAEKAAEARAEANKEALMSREHGSAEKKAAHEPGATGVSRKTTKQQKQIAYEKTMKEVRSHMNAPSRTFSKVIHAPVVEKTSEVVGETAARPNAILSGAIASLLIVSIVYATAKVFGYRLSGFETIGAFVVGWIIGLSYDYIRIMATGRR